MVKKIIRTIQKSNKPFSFLLISVVVLLAAISSLNTVKHISSIIQKHSVLGSDSSPFIASIDTMKESRDTETRPLTDAKIAQDVSATAQLNVTHITVATNWDYTDYFRRWAKAIHAAGKHIWVRGHPNQWENNNGAIGTMTPSMYEEYERMFILQNADVFQSGDIFDPASEPELGHYWHTQYPIWTPATTTEYNQFLRDSTDVANGAFTQKGISGVITTIHSTNAWMAIHRLEPATLAKMGVVTIDSYPDQNDTSVDQAVTDRITDISKVYTAIHMPIILGEIGYSNKINVDDQTQEAVLKAEFAAIKKLPYVIGANYWVGAGGAGHGGYTNILVDSAGKWQRRLAATDLAQFFQDEKNLHTNIFPPLSPTPIVTISPIISISPVQVTCTVSHFSEHSFCMKIDGKNLARATFTWDTNVDSAGIYTISYGRIGHNLLTKTTTSPTITLPESSSYGFYTDGSMYTASLHYVAPTCPNAAVQSLQFTPKSCN